MMLDNNDDDDDVDDDDGKPSLKACGTLSGSSTCLGDMFGLPPEGVVAHCVCARGCVAHSTHPSMMYTMITHQDVHPRGCVDPY